MKTGHIEEIDILKHVAGSPGGSRKIATGIVRFWLNEQTYVEARVVGDELELRVAGTGQATAITTRATASNAIKIALTHLGDRIGAKPARPRSRR